MTYNTNNPVPSVDVRDLYDNAQNLDSLVNGPAASYPDRLGVSRKSYRGMELDFAAFLAASGFELPPLAYVDGSPLAVDRPTQLIERDGILYSVKATESFPATLTGTFATDQARLVVRTDSDLRQDLANYIDQERGANLVGYRGRTVYSRLSEAVSVLDYQSVQDAVNALPDGGALLFPGDYQFTTEVSLAGKRNITIYGNGAKLRAPDARFRSFFDCTGSSGYVRFSGLSFDQRGLSMPVYLVADYPTVYNVAVHSASCENIIIDNCVFLDLYTRAVSCSGINSLDVFNSWFYSGVQQQNQTIEHVLVITASALSVTRCKFLNAAVTSPSSVPAGIVASGIRLKSVISGNLFNYCGRNNDGGHRLAAIDFYYDSENTVVSDNTVLNCLAQFMRLSSCNNGTVKNNNISMSGFAEGGGTILSVEGFAFSGGINNGTKNVTVSGNTFLDELNRSEVAIGIYAYDWGFPSRACKVTGNTFKGCKFYTFVLGPYLGLEISDNDAEGFFSALKIAPTTGSVPITSTFGSEIASVIDGLVVKGNQQRPTIVNSVPLILFDAKKTPDFTGQVRAVNLEENQLSSPSASNQPAMYVRGRSLTNAEEIVVRNNRSRFNAGLCTVDGVHSLQAVGNIVNFSPSELLVNSSDINVITRRGNSCTSALSGVSQGQATLVAGAVVVSTPEAHTSARVLLTHQTRNGTTGQLGVANIVNGTSFQITSSSATDTSVVYWEIVK